MENVEVEDESSENTATDESPDEEEHLPRNIFLARTPDKTMSLSQAFRHTQANTSAVRQPVRTPRIDASQEMPSPSVAIQHRPEGSSPQLSDNGDMQPIEEEDIEMVNGSQVGNEADSNSSEGEELSGSGSGEASSVEDDEVVREADADPSFWRIFLKR